MCSTRCSRVDGAKPKNYSFFMRKTPPETPQLPFVGDDGGIALLRVALRGIGAEFANAALSPDERTLLAGVMADDDHGSRPLADPGGTDPWTQPLADSRATDRRRALGQFFTPWPIVETMVDWVVRQEPDRIVDVGCGTGRFALAAAHRLPSVEVIAVDTDPVATLLCRSHAHRRGLSNILVRCQDFLRAPLPPSPGRTVFVGNPPYVRHHRLAEDVKAWAAARCKELDVPFSGLAGLHAYFFLATALHAAKGDAGCYVTSAEWMDVNYGALVRRLLVERLGVLSVSVLDPQASAFDDAMTSAAITCFQVGRDVSSVRFSSVPAFANAEGPGDARAVPRAELGGTWGSFRNSVSRAADDTDALPLGSLFRVRRGIATGDNTFFIMTWEEARQRGLTPWAHPVIASGREVAASGGEIRTSTPHCIILLPRELDSLRNDHATAAKRFIDEGEQRGVHERYLCAHRSPWWWLGEARPAPIVASYMARRPPAFAANPHGVLLANIAHGLYPRRVFHPNQLRALTDMLNSVATHFVGCGRSYQGGLEKFEPREMERLRIPFRSIPSVLLPPLSDPLETRHAAAAPA